MSTITNKGDLHLHKKATSLTFLFKKVGFVFFLFSAAIQILELQFFLNRLDTRLVSSVG